jgi:hypothetical protein
VPVTQPERVKIPAPPLVGKQGAADKGPPPQPANERKNKDEVKDTPPKENQPASNTKDKDKGNDKNKDK